MRVSVRTTRLLLRGWLLLMLGLLGLGGAMAASAAWRAVIAHESLPPPAAIVATGYEADDHFPGAAQLYLADLPAAPPPTPGMTGTVALPTLPVPSVATTETGIVPARPFVLAGTSLDRSRALQCLADAVYYEAASEPDAGQRAVAQVVLNRVRHPAFPATVCGVVYQGSERGGCQFSFACDGSMARGRARAAWTRAAGAAAAALAGYVYAPVGLATHYHTYAVTPAWNRTLVMTDMVGAHLFHRWKGYWGTAAAFTQTYRGGEPLPAPHMPVAPLLPLPPPTIAAAVPITPPATILPAWRNTSVAPAPVPTDDRLPPASQVLPRWKDSGKPL